ncbi:alpha/beta hydrolase [Nocardioides korecus]
MPSLQHLVVSLVVGRLRRNLPVDDLPAMRAALTERNRRAEEGPPRRVRRGHEERVSNDHGFPVFELWRPVGDAEDSAYGLPRRSVLYLHGGAYTAPTDPRHWSFLSRFADALGARAVLPAYPLAPEFTVEDSFEAVLSIFDEVAAGSPDGVVLAGDSAGGGYALAVAEALRDRARRDGSAQPTHLVLIAPWVDLTGTTPGVEEAAGRDPWLSHPHLAVYASFWAGSDDPARLADPRVSPGLGSLDGLPPALMFCGTRDLIQPGCDALFARAEEAGWPLEYVVGPGLLHVYPLLPVPEAGPALEQAVRFCRS